MRTRTTVCPHCGSTDIGHDRSDVVSLLVGGSSRCRDCGYSGIFPEISPDDLTDYRESLPEVERDDAPVERPRHRGRLVIGVLLLLVGLGASSTTTWGNGLLAGLLALAIGAAVLAEELVR